MGMSRLAQAAGSLAERAEVVLLDGADRKLGGGGKVVCSIAARESVPVRERGLAHNLGRVDTGADNLESDLGSLLDRELFQGAVGRAKKVAFSRGERFRVEYSHLVSDEESHTRAR
jgi:hypothetical protein